MIPSLIFFLANTAIMASAIFIPNFARDIGATNTEIGIIGSVYGAAIFAASFTFGRASDLKGERRFYLRLGLLISTLAFFGQNLATSPLSLALIRTLGGLGIGIYSSSLIAYEFEAGGRLGAFSSYGSMGWAGGSVLAGIIGWHGEGYAPAYPFLSYWEVFSISGILFLGAFLLSTRLPCMKIKVTHIPFFPRDIIMKNYHVYAPMFLRNCGAAAIWIIFPLFLEDLGASMLWIGLIYFANAGTQVLIMRRLEFTRDTLTISLGVLLSGVVFLLYTLPGDYLHVIPLQVMLAVSYSFIFVGSLRYLTRTNEEKATSIGLLNSSLSISQAVGPLVGGLISESYGFHGVMYLAAALSFVGLIINVSRRGP